MQLNGSQIFVEVLCEQGVDTLFGCLLPATLRMFASFVMVISRRRSAEPLR